MARLGARLDAARGVHRDERGVGRREALDDLAHEVGVAGRVDERDAVPSWSKRRRPPSDSDSLRFCSSGSKSRLAVPSSTRPGAVMAPAAWSRCSARVVLPEPAWPARTTLRRRDDARRGHAADLRSCRPECGPRADRSPGRSRRSCHHIESAAMSGHSKWSQIKRQKGANDAKRGAVFTKIAREIAIAARAGGADPDANYRLRLAHRQGARREHAGRQHQARHRAGERAATRPSSIEEIVYEGYGPGGVAILVEAATDNRNRTAADVRAHLHQGGWPAGRRRRGRLAVRAARRRQRGARRQRCRRGRAAGHRCRRDDVDTEADPHRGRDRRPAELEAVRKALEAAGRRRSSRRS